MSNLLSRFSRDSWLALGLFVLLAIISGFSLYQETQAQALPPLANFSTQADGARALWLWLEALDYEVSDEATAVFAIPESAEVMLMLEPTTFIEAGEWAVIDEWVEAGGTLVIAGSGLWADQAFSNYNFRLNLREATVLQVSQQTPMMASPMQPEIPSSDALLSLQSSRTDFVVHFALGKEPVVVSLAQGNGRIVLTTFTTPFSNKGLQTPGYAELVLNLISAAGEAQYIWFDEWHHGVRAQSNEIANLGSWLRRTPLGRAFIFMAVVIFTALVLQGRSFGRPVPLPQDNSRRAPLEYITALANLSRRAGHRTAVLQDYHHRLKKSIGHRYRLNPTLSDDEFLAQLAEYNPNLDLAALRTLLQRLSVANIGENELVQLAAEVSEWLNH